MKYKLGKFIETVDERNSEDIYKSDSVRGISTDKKIIETKAKLDGVKLTSYKLFLPNTFAYVADTSRRGDKMSLAYNNSANIYLVSSISTVFRVVKSDKLNSDYLYMYFNRPEFDRFARFNSWGSARETFSWDDMCDIDIDLPPVEIQEKYVAVYKSLLANQQSYENGLEDLKLVCDATIEKLRREMPSEAIGAYIEQVDERNEGLDVTFVRGISTSKEIIGTKAKMDGVSVSNYKKLKPRQIAYVPDTSRRGDKISIAMNNQEETFLVSSISTIFQTNESRILPEYLMLFFSKSDFNRYARFHSWGSARETFNWEDMQGVKLPIPNINIQKSIVDIYNAYIARRELNEQLKTQIKDICPILINGAIREGKAYAEV